jgi:hypothetical protein
MADTGAPWNIPYVTPTDNPRVFPAADEAQALAIAAGLTSASPIKQVVSTTKTDVFSASVATATAVDVTSFSVTITPTSNTSLILVLLTASGGGTADAGQSIILRRDTTSIAIGDAAGNRSRITTGMLASGSTNTVASFSGSVLDAPATSSAVTYSVQLFNNATATATLYLNRATEGGGDVARVARGVSTLTAIEVAA